MLKRRRRRKRMMAVIVYLGFLGISSAHAQTPVDPAALPLSQVESIWAPAESGVNLKNLDRYVEPPLRDAVAYLLQRNVQTAYASANLNDAKAGGYHFQDNRLAYADLGIQWDSLSHENQEALLKMFPKELKDPRIGSEWVNYGRTGKPQVFAHGLWVEKVLAGSKYDARAVLLKTLPGNRLLHLYLPITPHTAVGEVSQRYLELLAPVKPQEKIDMSEFMLSDEEFRAPIKKDCNQRFGWLATALNTLKKLRK